MSVAIIIPVYATHTQLVEYLDQCLDSCIGQADQIIVWDDGSTVSLDAVEDAYEDVIFVHDDHHGKSNARNGAVEKCTCDLIYPVDADDWIAPDAVDKLLQRWNGKPVYSDVYRVHPGNIVKPFPLLDFDCDLCVSKCISSVNVLHSKAQWAAIGGWSEQLNLYEDWLYNAKLFWTFCAVKVDECLVYYRQHSLQSSGIAGGVGVSRRLKEMPIVGGLKNLIQDYVRSMNMAGCCGGRRTVTASSKRSVPQAPMSALQSAQAQPRVVTGDVNLTVDLQTLGDPGSGKVWCRYLWGRGMGAHKRRGMSTRRVYKRIQYGGVYAVDVSDSVDAQTFKDGGRSCGMVRLQDIPRETPKPIEPEPAAAVPPKPVEEIAKEPAVKRTPVSARPKTPADAVVPEDVQNLIENVSNYSISELKSFTDVLSLDNLSEMLAAEKASEKPRRGAIRVLEKALNAALPSE